MHEVSEQVEFIVSHGGTYFQSYLLVVLPTDFTQLFTVLAFDQRVFLAMQQQNGTAHAFNGFAVLETLGYHELQETDQVFGESLDRHVGTHEYQGRQVGAFGSQVGGRASANGSAHDEDVFLPDLLLIGQEVHDFRGVFLHLLVHFIGLVAFGVHSIARILHRQHTNPQLLRYVFHEARTDSDIFSVAMEEEEHVLTVLVVLQPAGDAVGFEILGGLGVGDVPLGNPEQVHVLVVIGGSGGGEQDSVKAGH